MAPLLLSIQSERPDRGATAGMETPMNAPRVVLTSTLLLFGLSACTAVHYTSPRFVEESAAHQTIAVLPFEMVLTVKNPDRITPGRLAAIEEVESLAFQAAFSDKVCIDEARLFDGEWAAAFGRQEAIHSGPFMGIEPTEKKVVIRYMDFWKVVDGKIVDNWVMVDFAGVMKQLAVDAFKGHGWENLTDNPKRDFRPDQLPWRKKNEPA